MSNLAEKLPKVVKTTLDDIENRRQALAKKIECWVNDNIPATVRQPIVQSEGLSVDSIRQAANAAGEELVGMVKTKWSVLRGGKAEQAEAPVAKTPAAKTPAAKSLLPKACCQKACC